MSSISPAVPLAPIDPPGASEDLTEAAPGGGDSGEAVGDEVRVLKIPVQVPQRRVDHHCVVGHIPYRDWCPHCVRGRGRNAGHRKKTGDHEIPMISFDYGFLGAGAGRLKGAARDAAHAKAIAEGLSPMLVYVDDTSGAVFGHIVPAKGTDNPMSPVVIAQIVQDLDSLGYKRIILRGDQEPALGALMTMVKQAWHGEVVPESAPQGRVRRMDLQSEESRLSKGWSEH